MNHLSEDQIASCIVGDLTPNADAHLQECSRCAGEVERTRSALRQFRMSGHAAAEHYRITGQAARRSSGRKIWWIPAGAGLVAATALVSIVVAHLQTPQPQPEVFMRIPYVVPAAPYERTAVVRMNVPAAALIAAGLEVRSPAEDSLAADVLVGQDGRALAVSLVSDSGEANR